MNGAKLLKITALNLGIALGNIVTFSPGLLGVRIGGPNILGTAFGSAILFMSVALFGYGNYKLLAERGEIIQTNEIKTIEDYIAALKRNYDKKTFAGDIDIILEQIERLHNKQETLQDILLQRFNSTELSYQKFAGTIQAVADIFYLNLKSILNKLNAFDQDDYDRIQKDPAYQAFSQEFIATKREVYQEYQSFVKNAIEENEQIILKLDKLLLEISRLDSLETEEIENMSGMREIDALIKQTRYYK